MPWATWTATVKADLVGKGAYASDDFTQQELVVLRNTASAGSLGAGSFGAPERQTVVSSDLRSLQLVDLNGDGALDLAGTIRDRDTGSTDLVIFRGGTGGLGAQTRFPNADLAFSTDLDADGQVELYSGTFDNGTFTYGLARLDLSAVATSLEADASALALTLDGTWPHPASGNATVPFALPTAGHARLTLYDLMGRRVAVLADQTLAAGPQRASLDAGSLAAGTYLLVLEHDGVAHRQNRRRDGPLTLVVSLAPLILSCILHSASCTASLYSHSSRCCPSAPLPKQAASRRVLPSRSFSSAFRSTDLSRRHLHHAGAGHYEQRVERAVYARRLRHGGRIQRSPLPIHADRRDGHDAPDWCAVVDCDTGTEFLNGRENGRGWLYLDGAILPRCRDWADGRAPVRRRCRHRWTDQRGRGEQ